MMALSLPFKVESAEEAAHTDSINTISTPAIGDTYRAGETIEIEVTYSEPVAVSRTPRIGLAVAVHDVSYLVDFEAVYLRGSGTNKLVFGWVVSPRAADDSGVQLTGEPGLTHAWRPSGGSVNAVADGFPAIWTLAGWLGIPNSKADGRLSTEGGICARTKNVRDAIVAKVADATDCSQVTAAHLAALTGTLTLESLASVEASDLAGLNALTTLELNNNTFSAVPNGLFDELGALTALQMNGNTLTTLPAGIFRELGRLTTLEIKDSGVETLPAGLFEGLGRVTSIDLSNNGIERLPKEIFRNLDTVTNLSLENNAIDATGLPDAVFEPLINATEVTLSGNPGASAWKPQPDAGPDQLVSAGQRVTLDGQVSAGPWGSNTSLFWINADTVNETQIAIPLPNSKTLSPTFTAPTLESQKSATLKLYAHAPRGAGQNDQTVFDSVLITVRGLATTGLEIISEPVSGLSEYRRGEVIEIALGFNDLVLVDSSRDTPVLPLTIGTSTRNAAYARGSGTNQLVFEYTIGATDVDTDGISVAANSLSLEGGTITSVWGAPALLGHEELATQADHKVDGPRRNTLIGGICGRTPQIRDRLVELVRTAQSDNTLTCAQVTNTHLSGLDGEVVMTGGPVDGKKLSALKTGDFAGLNNITGLYLDKNRLRDIPAGTFDPMTGLRTIELDENKGSANDGLTTLPKGLFDKLTDLRYVDLRNNDLTSLPPRIFENLRHVVSIQVEDNPGEAKFVPTARAGEDRVVTPGTSVVLGGQGAEKGYDDPWGSNIESWSWVQTAGTPVTFAEGKGADTARPQFTAPTTGENLSFELTVTAAGDDRRKATDTVHIEVRGAPRIEEVWFTGTPRGLKGNQRTYGLNEWIDVGLRYDRAMQVDATRGTPTVLLAVGNSDNRAVYRRGSGTTEIIFGYRVRSADRDINGVVLIANSLRLNGGSITGVSDRAIPTHTHSALAGGSNRTVDGSVIPGSSGICARTPAVAAAIVAKFPGKERCSDVRQAELASVTGRLDVSAEAAEHGRISALRNGDFAGLTGVTELDLDYHAIRVIPPTAFNPLSALTALSMAYNQTQGTARMRTLPAGLFDALTSLAVLRLEQNDLETLPDNLFEPLTNLRTLTLEGNPGSADFLPQVRAGPEGGVDAQGGERVTLSAETGPNPWGANVTYAWSRGEATTQELSRNDVQRPEITVVAAGVPTVLEYSVVATARGTNRQASDKVNIRVGPTAAVTGIEVLSTPADGGTEYHVGETVEIGIEFTRRVVVTDEPGVVINFGTETRFAPYNRGSGTSQLVFAYTIGSNDGRNTDGVSMPSGAISTDTGTVRDANGQDAVLTYPALRPQRGHGVDATTQAVGTGICTRSPAVRNELVKKVQDNESDDTLTCATVTGTHLAALTGTLELGNREAGVRSPEYIRNLKAGDFDGLSAITRLDMYNNRLRTFPPGILDPMVALTGIETGFNSLEEIPAGLFDQLTGLIELNLDSNNLSSLPARIFEKLTALERFSVANNPGTQRFTPTARAGEDVTSSVGRSVTLGVEGAENGFDDPWGTNVTYEWTWLGMVLPGRASPTLEGADSARALVTLTQNHRTDTFRLTVTGVGSGGSASSTDDVKVTVGAAPTPTSATVNGDSLTLTYNRDLETSNPTSQKDKGAVYVATVRTADESRGLTTARGTTPRARGSTVTMTLQPPANYGERITLSYEPDNATDTTRVRDIGGNLANAFAGFEVKNQTPQPAHVDSVAFADSARTYGIGDTIAVEVTFSETVNVTGTPTVDLEIGTETRQASYTSGSGTTVLRFAYTVAEGDEETAAVTISANGLKTPGESAIKASAGNEAATRSHESLRSTEHKVDGVRPTIEGAELRGPVLTLVWSEALVPEDEALRPEAFTVKFAGVAEPTPRSVSSDTVDRRTLRIVLARSARGGQRAATLDYDPGTRALKDFTGNNAQAIQGRAINIGPGGYVPARGLVNLTGAAHVGETLSATLSDVVDLDGLAESPIYTFTWLRVDGANETTITTTRTDQARSRYTLATEDAWMKVRARVEFEDYVGNDETLQSDAFPAVGSIGWARDSTCPRPDLSGREVLWTATMTVGSWTLRSRQLYGYRANQGGMLSDDTVVIDGTEYTIVLLDNELGEKITFETNQAIALTSLPGLRLDICNQGFTLNNPYENLFELYTTGRDDWSTRSTRQVYLSKPDVTAPVLQKIELDAATLTLTYDEALKATSPAPASAFTIGVTGGGTLNASNIRAGVGAKRNKVTMTLDPPAEHGQTYTVAYAADSASAATRIQDANSNAAAGFTQAPVVVRNATPAGPHVDAVAFTGTAQTATSGDAIGIDVTFSEAVTITGTPRLRLQVGSEGVWAQWKGGQSSRTVHPFEYTVAEDDVDSDGVTIEGSTLETPSGSTIRTTATNKEVQLSHATVYDPTRTVDALRPNVAERGAVEITGQTVTVTWSEALDESATPAGTGGFRLRVPGTTDPVVTQVTLSGAVATLTLDSAVPDGKEGVTLDYNPPSGTKIQDVAGNSALAFSGRRATVAADTRAPEVTDTVVSDATITVTFDEPLSGTTAPAAAFTVRVTRKGSVVGGYTVSTASIDNAGTVLSLTLNQAVRPLDEVRLTYTKPSAQPMQDRSTSENLVENFEIGVNRNLTAGVREITFENTDENLAIGKHVSINVWFTTRVQGIEDETAQPEVTVVIGTQRRQARYSGGTGTLLEFDYVIADGDEDTDGIEIPANALSTPGGSSIVTEEEDGPVVLVSLDHDAVGPDPRHVVDGVRPSVTENGAVAVAGPMVTVTWSEPLDGGSVPAGDGGFTLRVAGAKHANVTKVAIAGATMTLTLDASVADGTQDVTLDYTPPSDNSVRDVLGNTAAAFTGRAATVTADTRAPQVAKATVEGTALTIMFDEALSGTTAPTSAFTVGVSRGGTAVSGITVSAASIDAAGKTLTLTLSAAVQAEDAVTVTYTAPTTNKLRDRATVANAVANFETGTAGTGYQVPAVENVTPGVNSVSFAGAAAVLAIGDKVEIDVTFSEPVAVTTSASARPQIGVLIGTETRQARYVSGTASTTLRFEYEIVGGDVDTNGIGIPANALNVPTGSAIDTQRGNRTVQLTHEAVAEESTRTIDGVRPRVAVNGAVSVTGPTVVVTWSKQLDEEAVPSGAGGFVVLIAGAAGPAVTRVTVQGMRTTLTLESAIANGTQNVTLDYSPPSGTKVRDIVGNAAAAFRERYATVEADTRAPQLASAVINGPTLILTFDEALTMGPAPATSAFNVSVTRGGTSISGITVQFVTMGNASTGRVGLTLSQTLRSGDVVVLSYTAPSSNQLRDVATTPNDVAYFETGEPGVFYTVPAVENVTVSPSSIAFAGTAATLTIGDKVEIDVTYSEAVRVTTSADAQPHIGVLIGTQTRQARYASGSGSTTLRFEYLVADGDEDTDGIEIEANALNISHGNPIETGDGSWHAQLVHDAVAPDTGRTVDGVRPTVAQSGAVAVEGGTVTVTWSETLDETSVPSGAGGFTVKVAGAQGPEVTQVAIAGATTTLTLDAEIANGTQDVTLDYSPPASNAIKDAVGNPAVAFSARTATVTADTRAPRITDASIDGATVMISFDEALSGTTAPVAAFSASVIRAGSTVSGITVSNGSINAAGTTLTLTLSQAVRGADEVVVRYTAPSANALRDRATPANGVADFETGSSSAGYDVPAIRNATPSVIGVAFAGTATTLGIGAKVEIDATFNQVVTVTTSASARPEIEVLIGTETRAARYVSGSASTSLRFEYVVVENDEDDDGIEIGANALSVPAGSAIRTQAGNRTVELGHSAVRADSARTVDGVRPTLSTAQAEGPTITVTWSEALDETSIPEGAGGMRVRIGNANGPAVTSVSVSGSSTVLNLASAIADGTQDVTLEYDASRASPPVRDAAGNAAASIPQSEAAEVQVGDDMRAPEVAGAPRVDGAALAVTFDERLDANSVPSAPGGFTVTVTRSGATVPNITVSALALDAAGTTLTLTLSDAVRGGDTVVLGYAPPATNALKDRATTPNTVAAFTTGANGVPEVVNGTPSVSSVAFAGTAQALALGDTIVVEAIFTEAVRAGTSGSARPQIALSIGTDTRQARYARGSGSDTLAFEYTIASGDEDTDGIEIAANALSVPTGSSIRTQAGNRIVQLGHDAVAREAARTVDAAQPQAQSAEVEGQTVIVRWSEAIDEASERSDAGGFVLRYGGAQRPAVTAVAVDDNDSTKVRLTLDAVIPDGTQGVTLAWSPPASGVPIRDLAGNTGAAFTDTADRLAVSVTPDTTVPTLTSATAGRRVLKLTFSEPLDETSVPAPAQFTITVERDGNTVGGYTADDVDVTGTMVTLTLARGVVGGDAVTLAYATPTQTTDNPLRDRAITPNEVAAFTTGTGSVARVVNTTAVLTAALSHTTVTEGADTEIELTVSVGSGQSTTADQTVAFTATGTATHLGDWSAEPVSATLGAGEESVTLPITIIDDAVLESEETATFSVTADGVVLAELTLTIADDDKVVLAVVGPEEGVEEGGNPATLKLRLEPHFDNALVLPAPDACVVDFPVTATLSATAHADEVTATPPLPRDVEFAATSLSDCTREVTIELETRASDGEWEATRTVSFELAPKADQDARVEAGTGGLEVIDDTAAPGPTIGRIEITPVPPQATDDYRPARNMRSFQDVPDEALHGQGSTLTFTATFDAAITVTPDPDTGEWPELVLDVFGRERRATLTDNRSETTTLAFEWTVALGDNDPDGIEIRSLDLNGGAIRFSTGCENSDGETIACDVDLAEFAGEHGWRRARHRIRGGFFSIEIDTERMEQDVQEGSPYRVWLRRNGGYDEPTTTVFFAKDSAFERGEGRAVKFEPEGHEGPRGEISDGRRASAEVVIKNSPGENPERVLAITIGITDSREGQLRNWYEAGPTTEANISVTEGESTVTEGVLTVAGEDIREPETGTTTATFRICLWSEVACPLPLETGAFNSHPGYTHEVRVDYKTIDESAVAGEDYTAASGTLVFAPGETRKFVEIEVHADAHDEPVESFWLELSNAVGADLGRARTYARIHNNGPIPKAWITRFGRTVAEQVLDAVDTRMDAVQIGSSQVSIAGAQVRLDEGGGASTQAEGQDPAAHGVSATASGQKETARSTDGVPQLEWMKKWAEEEAERDEFGPESTETINAQQLFSSTAFSLSRGTPGEHLVGTWGGTAISSFDGREGDLLLDGEVKSVMLGADWTSGSGRGAWSAGLVASHSAGKGSWSGAMAGGDGEPGISGEIEAMLNSVFPWVRYALTDETDAWASAGLGQGTLEVTPNKPGTEDPGATLETDLSLRMGAVGLRGTLLDAGAKNLTLRGKTDAMIVETQSGRTTGMKAAKGAVSRLRAGVEATRPFMIDRFGALTLSSEIGVRHDAGDAETGWGLDLGGGLAIADTSGRLQAEIRGRGLLAHEADGMKERGWSGTLGWRENAQSERGVSVSLNHSVGDAASGGAEALLSRTTLDDLTPSGDEADSANDALDSQRLDLTVGYGMSAFGGRFTAAPEARMGFSESHREFTAGWRLTQRSGENSIGTLELSIEATRNESTTGDAAPENRIGLQLNARF